MEIWAYASLYNMGMFLVYSIIPVIMQLSSAAFFNVNLLTADFYTILYGILIQKYQVRVSSPFIQKMTHHSIF